MGRAAHTFDQRGIKLVGRAVQIDPGPRLHRREKGRAQIRDRGQKLIDKRILGRADLPQIEQAAIQASCETRLLVGQQAQAFTAAALPLCRRL